MVSFNLNDLLSSIHITCEYSVQTYSLIVHHLFDMNCGTPDKMDGVPFHFLSSDAIKSIVENNPNKEIVIITHHCPSPRCISDEHKNSNINSSFVSDLESFIETHDNIKCWICGHVHNQVEEKINNCLLVCNPLGYMKRDENPNWTINKFINTDTWEIVKIN